MSDLGKPDYRDNDVLRDRGASGGLAHAGFRAPIAVRVMVAVGPSGVSVIGRMAVVPA